jgi:hypothetical protein
MAEEKKPKIDLKARLGKGAAKDAGTPPPPPVEGSSPVVPPPVAPSAPISSAPAITPGLPVPPGIPVGPPPALDASNPLARAAGLVPTSAPASVAPAAPARIEIDETAVHAAASKARRTGAIIAVVTMIIGVGVGWVAGGASEQANARTASHNDAQDLKKNVDSAKVKLEDLAKKLEDGQAALSGKAGAPTFPKDLANQLGGVNVDFEGSQLAGRRFMGFPKDTTANLVEFITGVQALNEHKNAVKNMLTKLEKPLTEQFAAAQSGQRTIQHVVLLGGPTGKDPAGNYVANLALLSPPITFTGDKPEIPAELKAVFGGQNVGVSRFKGGPIGEPAAIYVTPGSFNAVCPSETKSAAAQLAVKLGELIRDIRGEKTDPNAALVEDKKPGLLERAETLSKALEKI